MDADQLDLKITGHVVTPGRVLEDGWIGVRGEIVAGLGPADSAAPAARQVIDARASGSCPGPTEAARGLWDQVASGVVDMITSDHSPWDIAKKSRPDDIFANASGIPGVQTLLPLAYAGVVAGHGLPVPRLAELVAASPARVFGLAPRKGQLTAGADADLVVLDPAGTTRLHPGAMQSSATWSPYHGMELPGRIGLTMVRGRVVYDGSSVTGPPGGGRLVRPQRASSSSPAAAAGR
jgi:hypothetical protein